MRITRRRPFTTAEKNHSIRPFGTLARLCFHETMLCSASKPEHANSKVGDRTCTSSDSGPNAMNQAVITFTITTGAAISSDAALEG